MSKKYLLPIYAAVSCIVLVCLGISLALAPQNNFDGAEDAYKTKSLPMCVLVM